MASKTSGRRRTTPQKKKAASGKAAAKRKEENAFIRDEIKLLVLFAVSILLLISNFGLGGAAGAFVSGIMFGLFGVFAYALPVCLFLVAAFSISNRNNTIAAIKGGAMVVAVFLFCALFQMFGGEKDGAGTAAAFYTYSAEHKAGGGFFGGMISKALTGAFGTVGAWIILIVLLIICAVIITERSFISGVKKGSRKVYDTAREDARRHRVLAEERRAARLKAQEEQAAREEEEQKKARIEHKVSGVALEETTMKKEVYTDEMREITLEDSEEPELKDLDEMFRIPIERERFAEREEDEEEQRSGGTDEQESPAEVVSEMPDEEMPDGEIPDEGELPAGVFDGDSPKQAPEQRKKPSGSVPEASGAVQARRPVPPVRKRAYIYPPLKLLNQVKHTENRDADRILHETAMHLQQILRDFGVGVTVTNVSQGPAVTRYEIQPDQGVKVSRIVSLADDIKLNLAVADVRIEAPIPGKAAVGIEVPNAENAIVPFRELVSSHEFKNHKSKLAFAVGKDIAGKIVVTDIAKMPHLLIAGATGSGKSVCINTLIMSILYKAAPDEVKLIMIDPKVVELSVYNGIPHLLIPVVTDPKKAAGALNWAVAEMTHRYKLFADYNVRNLAGYNEKIKEIEHIEDDTKPEKLPQIVIVVDELADLMMVAPGEVEDAICRLAQLARAAGIHLVIATQRPSVNVITGLIKANMPSRIAFAVSSGVDSRTILDMNGAEKLLGKGDMLFYPYGYPKPVRVQGAFVSDDEVGAVVDFLKENNNEVAYSTEVEEHINTAQPASAEGQSGGSGSERDALFAEAGKFIIEKDKASIGMLQRWFKVGFNRAARIMDQLAEAGVVGEEAGTKPREILMTLEEFERYLEEYA
ncbi:MAG TPA: DNA translocase FtsK [Candidatus Merdisoma merdipullorum]|nr:DNA translocase FtsK [Candidatus Merdisoma merdipullorum]